MRTEVIYPILILEKEKQLIEKLIKSASWDKYPEALKDRKLKVKQLEKAINKLRNEN